jgi:hypothetical protein
MTKSEKNHLRRVKEKRCKLDACKKLFTPFQPLQQVCSWDCGLAWTRQKEEKKQRQITRQMKAKLKTKSQWLKEAQAEFNKFIRLRDHKLPCISCQRHHEGQYHAGHYRAIGAAPEIRFHEDNVHKQCSVCNNHKSGNQIEYRINLVKRIGRERVEALETKHEPKHYTIDDVKEIKRKYRGKARELLTSQAKAIEELADAARTQT